MLLSLLSSLELLGECNTPHMLLLLLQRALFDPKAIGTHVTVILLAGFVIFKEISVQYINDIRIATIYIQPSVQAF